MTRRLLRSWLVACVLLAAMGLPSAAAQEAGPVYIVQEGDTIWGISQTFGVDPAALLDANGLTANSVISPGMQLVIPGFPGAVGVLTTSEIGFGENLESAGERYGVPLASLARLNRVVNQDRLYIGQEVILPLSDAAPLGLRESVRRLKPAETTVLELAAQSGQNPWVLTAKNQAGPRLWAVSGEPLAVPAQGRVTSALVAPFEAASITPAAGVQGHTMTIALQLEPGAATPTGTLGEWTLNFEPLPDGGYVALQGIHAMAEPGMYDVRLQIGEGDGAGVGASFEQPLPVRAGKFGREAFDVPQETLDPKNTGPEDEQVAALVGQVTPEKMWGGAFAFPSRLVTDTFPSIFGTRRSYNGTAYDRYHTGLDFYGGTGVSIYAPAPGRVVFAGPLTVRGNATYIDHGWGVFTGYFHQSEILVQVGQVVEAGEEIGKVGATGRVTGPHLHWEIWVGGVPVDPMDWVNQSYP
jgi:murein DD-endopeptidase MepM/ murein hydrolase activator NlpD